MRRGRSISFEYCYRGWVVDSSFWPWRKTTEHAIQEHFISLPEKIQNSAVCRQGSFDCFLGLTVYMKKFLEAGNTVNSARYIETIKTYSGECVKLGGQHRRFCCCMTVQDRTLLAQRLMLWRRWCLRFSPIRPAALTWRQAISISFLTSRGISRGLIPPQMMKWSKLWRRGSNKELLNSSLTARVNLF